MLFDERLLPFRLPHQVVAPVVAQMLASACVEFGLAIERQGPPTVNQLKLTPQIETVRRNHSRRHALTMQARRHEAFVDEGARFQPS